MKPKLTVMFREEPDRTGFLFDMDSGASVVLNRTGCFLWKLAL